MFVHYLLFLYVFLNNKICTGIGGNRCEFVVCMGWQL